MTETTTAPARSGSSPTSAQNAQPRRSYAHTIWNEFKQSRWSLIGLVMVAFFCALAFFAPFIAHRLPLMWKSADGMWTFPLIRELFAPTESTEPLLEIFYNYLLLTIPCIWIVRTFMTKNRIVCAVLACALLLPFFLTKSVNDTHDYIALQKENQGRGLFPLLPYGPNQQGFGAKRPPSWQGYHLCGTDEVGRDVFVRLVHGARVSLAVGFVSVGLATLIGLLIGASSGYFGGWIDMALSRIVEIMICFPTFFLILTIIAIMDKRSILNIMLVIGLTGWTGVARLARGEVLKQKSLDYVTSAQALGAGNFRIIFRHILPNAIAPVLVNVSFGIAGAILTESGLSFLGFGVAPPTATWGELLNQARSAPLINWWLVLFPGVAIFFGVVAYNLVGEGLRDAMDPRLRKSGGR